VIDAESAADLFGLTSQSWPTRLHLV